MEGGEGKLQNWKAEFFTSNVQSIITKLKKFFLNILPG